jgi:competence protein ComFC
MLWSVSKKWKARVLDALYPLHCPACRNGLPPGAVAGDFCEACRGLLVPVEPPFCQVCAEPFPGDITGDFTCPNCLGRHQAYDFAVCSWLSRGPVREVVHRLKYDRFRPARLALARLMLPALADPRLSGIPWLLVPVPLHPRKQRQRSYNQSLELAVSLTRLTGLACSRALSRIRPTQSQAGLDRAGRLKNLRGAFAVRRGCVKRITGASILLIDDVLTTGATAHECALALKEAGAVRVAVLTAARG